MEQNQISWTPFIFGGLFIGAWLYGMLFGFPAWHDFNVVAWSFWGLLGLALAGGGYAAVLLNQWARIAIVIGLGVALGILILATILEQEAHIVATFVTTAGGALIVAGAPRPARDE